MESLSRPLHRRKHSTSMANAFSSFSSKNPYDDVLFSSGGGGPGSVGTKLGVQDYAEIFSGSQRGSSIPVLDLSGLEERSGSGDFRSSKLDYSNIFGGFRDEDVAVPYEQLFTGGKTRKTSSDKPRPPAKAGSPLHESSDQLNPSGKKREFSVEVPDESPDSTKQHFNLSFNKSGPRTNGGSNGKMHVTQLHAVPGFTSFVDGTANLPKTEGSKSVPSLKREVSRAWSFSAEMDKKNSSKSKIPISNGAVKGNAGSRPDELNITDKPSNTEKINNITDKPSNTEKINLKSRDLNELKGARRTRSSSFGSKTDALEKSIGESASPSIFQPSVNEQKGPTRTRSLSFGSKADASRKIDGDSSPPFLDEELDVNSDAAASAAALKKAIEQAQESIRIAKEIMERRREFRDGSMGRVKVRKDKKEKSSILEAFERLDPELPEFTEVDRKFSPSPGQKEPDFNAGKIEKEKLPENVEGANENSMTRHSPGSPGLEVNAEGRTVTLGSVQVNNQDNSLHAMNKLVAEIKEIETDEKIFDETEVGVNHVEGLVNVTELGYPGSVLDTSHRVQEVEEIVDEEGECLRIHEDGAMTEEKRNDVDENVNCTEELEIHEEIVSGQEPKLQKLVFDDLVNETQNPPQKGNEEGVVIQDQVERNVESVLECNDEEEEISLSKEEPNFWFEAEEDPRESPEEGINDREQRFGGDEEPETDEKKPTCAHAQDEQEMPVAKEDNVIEEKLAETSEYEAAETREMKENTSYEDQKIEASLEAEETGSTLSGTGKSGDNLGMCDFQDVALEKDVDISVDEYGSDSSASVTETREASPVELNDDSVDENQAAVESKEEEFGLTKVAETFSAIEKNEEKEQVEEIFQQEDDELLEKASLLRSASESNFVSSKFQNAFEGLSSDGNTENSSDTDHHEEKLPNDEENATEKNMQDFPELHDHVETATDVDHRDVKVAVEQSSESDEWSGSISSLENTDELSAHETQVFADNVKDESSSKEGDTDDVEMTDNAMKHDEEQKEGVSSPPREIELNEEPVEAERGTETAQNSENNTSTAEAGDAKEDVRKLEKKDCQQRIEAIRREREKEKERIAVERAIREARERAFAEARERAERAAVERAAVEARQRTMAGAREKLEKAPGSCKPSSKQSADKATNEAKLRTERAAVERATAEARERALEKAFSQKTPNEAKAQAEKYSGASRSNTLKHSYSSSDLEKYDGNNTESAQRRKARLERHQRIMERAAKALAEKNMRDILAQREQAERNRLAESLDADIKRWASGKEGNLRALLSTLQYILGPDSGWQPISLTEIITTPAVKKAYRKATLYVHPDKLQQKGASIQQKYICEKVFDLLKAAWNRFNSEER